MLIDAANSAVKNLDQVMLPSVERILWNPQDSRIGQVLYSKRSRPVSGSHLRLLHQEFPRHEADGLTNRYVWHEWNIQDHTTEFLNAFYERINMNGRFDPLNPRISLNDANARINLKEEIDGIAKLDLLYYACAYHDLGKFFPLINENKSGKIRNRLGQLRYTHTDHERLSSNLFTSPELPVLTELKEKGFTEKQISYMKNVIVLHYELGKLRSMMMHKSKQGFSVDSVNSEAFGKVLEKFFSKTYRQKYRYEIPLMFLFDSLAKVSNPPKSLLDFDQPYNLDKSSLTKWAHEAIGQPLIERAVLSLPVNVLMAKRALEYVNQMDEANMN